jgi:hypothetical protein
MEAALPWGGGRKPHGASLRGGRRVRCRALRLGLPARLGGALCSPRHLAAPGWMPTRKDAAATSSWCGGFGSRALVAVHAHYHVCGRDLSSLAGQSPLRSPFRPARTSLAPRPTRRGFTLNFRAALVNLRARCPVMELSGKAPAQVAYRILPSREIGRRLTASNRTHPQLREPARRP